MYSKTSLVASLSRRAVNASTSSGPAVMPCSFGMKAGSGPGLTATFLRGPGGGAPARPRMRISTTSTIANVAESAQAAAANQP